MNLISLICTATYQLQYSMSESQSNWLSFGAEYLELLTSALCFKPWKLYQVWVTLVLTTRVTILLHSHKLWSCSLGVSIAIFYIRNLLKCQPEMLLPIQYLRSLFELYLDQHAMNSTLDVAGGQTLHELLLKRREKHGRNATDRWSCKGFYEEQHVIFNFLTSDHIQQLSRFGRYFKCGKDDMLVQFPILQSVRRPSLIHQFATCIISPRHTWQFLEGHVFTSCEEHVYVTRLSVS